MEPALQAVIRTFEESLSVKQRLLEGSQLASIADMALEAADCIAQGGKLMLCGNGGSAADAQHLAAELLIRLRPSINRAGVPAIALAQDVSTITACGNDFGYDVLFERLVHTLGRANDVLVAITTSGKSPNILRALRAARTIGIRTYGFLGSGGGEALPLCDRSFLVPSESTGRIQEAHIVAGHALMEGIEDRLLSIGYIQLGKT